MARTSTSGSHLTDVSSGRGGSLSREQVLVAALSIVDGEGIDALSMRRLGDALAASPMALYRYAENKSDLLDGIAETLKAQIIVDPAAPDWEAELRTYFAFLNGHIRNEIHEITADPVATNLLLTLHIHRLDPSEFPHPHDITSELADYDGDHDFEVGLSAILDGIAAQLPSRPRRARRFAR